MKKLAALLMAALLTLALTTSALAYTAVTPENNKPAITHTLTLTDAEAAALAYEITYNFSVTSPATIMQPSGVTNADLAVSGAPTIGSLSYGPNDTFDSNSKSCTKNLEIDWSGVEIKEPGVYRWEVTKTWSDTDTTADPTNNSAKTYLYVYAIDNGGTLTIESVGMTSAAELNDSTAKGNLEDTYPAKTLNLSISKTVTGNQGSKNQYFKFTVQLTSPAGAINKTYQITGHDASVPATAYHEAKTNVTSIAVNGGSSSSVELWLKHGQTAVIEDLLFGTAYTITESENTGYTVTSAITGDATGTTADGATASDTSLEVTSYAAFTNNKEAVVPTGVTLQSTLPVIGIVLAMGLMAVAVLGKKKEDAA